MQPENTVVVGAGGGIGAALVDALAATGAHVFAVARRPVSTTCDHVSWIRADASNGHELVFVVEQLPEVVHSLYITTGALHGPCFKPEKSLAQLNWQSAAALYQANALLPLAVLRACLPRLTHDNRSIAMVLSAQVGSIGDNQLGGWYAYRMAKAALNMGLKTVSIELSRRRGSPIVASVHPGTTATALSAPFVQRRRASLSSAFATAQRLVDLGRQLSLEDSGRFMDSEGGDIVW